MHPVWLAKGKGKDGKGEKAACGKDEGKKGNDSKGKADPNGKGSGKSKAKAKSMPEKIKMAAVAHVSHHRDDGKTTDLRLAEASVFAMNGHPECIKKNCADQKCYGVKNHSGWPALKKRGDIIGAAAVVDIPQTCGICGQSGSWWTNNVWTADNVVQEIVGAAYLHADEEVQQIPPPGYATQGDEGYDFAPPDAYVEEVLDEE